MSEIVSQWDADFIEIDQETLFELILATNYMDIKPLLDLCCARVASMIKGKTPEQIRKVRSLKIINTIEFVFCLYERSVNSPCILYFVYYRPLILSTILPPPSEEAAIVAENKWAEEN